MSDSEKPLKIASFILSGLLIASALLYVVFGQTAPVKAEVVMEYSAPDGLQPSELLAALETLRNDEAFLKEVAVRSGLGSGSEPDFAETVTGLARNLAFVPNFRDSCVAIRFTHRNSATAVKAATAAAIVAKEKLEQQREKLAHEILCLEDAVEDKRKLLEHVRRTKALDAGEARTESAWGPGYEIFIDPELEYKSALKRLAELKAKPVFSIGAIHSKTLSKK
jgi:hypothetical protein